ncbi:MAG TPA: YciI family protein [Candidatus Methylomirabilis sp.]|nr:YciI family protein [Candidatus Methylomirabilis sp.]
MKYLCLVYIDEARFQALSESERQNLIDEALEYDEVLRKSGHYLTSNALQSVETSTTIRIRNGKVFTTDGPFAETKEQLGGFMLIEASDLNDAIRVASKIPPVRLGCIEVRPVMELAHS